MARGTSARELSASSRISRAVSRTATINGSRWRRLRGPRWHSCPPRNRRTSQPAELARGATTLANWAAERTRTAHARPGLQYHEPKPTGEVERHLAGLGLTPASPALE